MAKIIDLVTNKGAVDTTAGIVEEALASVPEIQFFDAGTIPGTVLHRRPARSCNGTSRLLRIYRRSIRNQGW